MTGAMRKMGIYLGLVDEDGRQQTDSRYGNEWYDEPLAPEDGQEPIGDERSSRRFAYETAPAPRLQSSALRAAALGVYEDDLPAYRITTHCPSTYNEALTVGEQFRDGCPVIMNLTEMDDAAAKRLVDFAAGLTFGCRGRLEKVTGKVFLLTPQNIEVTAEDRARIAEGTYFFNQS